MFPHTIQTLCSVLSLFEQRVIVIWSPIYSPDMNLIEDAATRQIITAKVDKHHASQLVLSTLAQFFATGARPAIFHSDQGTEFIA